MRRDITHPLRGSRDLDLVDLPLSDLDNLLLPDSDNLLLPDFLLLLDFLLLPPLSMSGIGGGVSRVGTLGSLSLRDSAVSVTELRARACFFG